MSRNPKHIENLWVAQTRAQHSIDGAYAWLRWCFDQMEPSLAAKATKALMRGKNPAEFIEEEKSRS